MLLNSTELSKKLLIGIMNRYAIVLHTEYLYFWMFESSVKKPTNSRLLFVWRMQSKMLPVHDLICRKHIYVLKTSVLM